MESRVLPQNKSTVSRFIRCFGMLMAIALLLSSIACSSNKAKLVALQAKAQADSLFLESQFSEFKKAFPRVAREDYFAIAVGKPRNYCLFQKLHILECTDFGDHEYKYKRSISAKQAYQAAVLTEDYNTTHRNVRLYGALTQIALEEGDLYTAQVYLSRILFLNEGNSWAKKKLQTVLSSRD